MKEFAIPYIDLIEKQAKSIISYPNIDIRGKAATIFPKIVNIIATAGDQAKLSQYLKNYLTILVGAAEKETENEVVSYLLQSVDDCITGHDKTLSQEEVNQLFYKLFGIFDKVEKNRINLNKEKGVKELETEKKKAEPQDEDIDDNYEEEIALDNIKEGIEGVEDIITAFSDAIGALFKTHNTKIFPTKCIKFRKKNGIIYYG